MVSGRGHTRLYSLGGSGPKHKGECCPASEASPGIPASFDTDDCGPGEILSPSHCKKRLVQALQTKTRKCLLILACHGHLRLRAEAAFQGNSLNLTNTVSMTQYFTYAAMLMKDVAIEGSVPKHLHRHCVQPC